MSDIVSNPAATPGVFSTPAFFSMKKGAFNASDATLSFNGSNLSLTLSDGHVVFDEPLSNIKRIKLFNSLMQVVMPTGIASILFGNPAEVAKKDAMAVATGIVPGGIAGAAVGVKLANDAVKESQSGAGYIGQWEQLLRGKVTLEGSANTDIGNTKTGILGSIGVLMMICGGLFVIGFATMIGQKDFETYGIVGTIICALSIPGGYLLYKKGVGKERTSFPSSR